MTTHTTPDGRMFVQVGTEAYQRRDGSWTQLAVWQGSCRVCGKPFTAKTPASVGTQSKTFGLVHCADHRLTPREATERWLAAIGRSRQS